MNQKATYYKIVLEGKHYDIGKKRGEHIAAHSPLLKPWLMSRPEGVAELTAEEAEAKCALFDRYSTGLGEEIRGLADGLGIALQELGNVLNGYANRLPCACSVIGIAADKTTDGHAYIGQSYEYGYEDEYAFAIQRAEGSYAHMGFSFYQAGRFDGINEKGLCVAITCLDFAEPSAGEAEGFSFPFVVRILLDTCATTDEAIAKMRTLPICTNVNILIGDVSGNIIKAEILTKDGKADIIEVKAAPYTYGFNHFMEKGHREQYPAKRYFSHAREAFMNEISTRENKISKDGLQQILTDPLPNGMSCHAYTCYFGTLRSMIYDVTKSELYVCFGSPQQYPYVKMDLWEKESSEEVVEFTDEIMPKYFWEFV